MAVELTSVATTAEPTERLLGFSDAVFGIAITFLALELGDVPEEVINHEESVSTFLASHINDYVTYAGTFIIVGFLWSRHHQMFRYIKGRSGTLLVTNLFLLALIALLPYPAAMAGRGFGLGLALACLLVPLLMISVLLVALWELALRQQLVIPGLPAQTRASFRANTLAVAGVFALALVLALASWRLDSPELSYAAMGCALLLIVVPILVRLHWPTPQQASYVPPNANELADKEEKLAAAVLTLLERIRNGSDTVRLCVFTDGVFAIAVTVLALQLQPPAHSVTLTNEVIIENLQTVPWNIYLTTFAFVGIYWVTHIHTFEVVKGTDAILVWLNLLFLLFVAFLPLPTELVNLVEGSSGAWVLYFAVLFSICIFLAAMRIYGARTSKLSVERELPAEARYSIARTLWAAAAFLVGIALVTISRNPIYGEVVLVLILLRGPVLRRVFPAAHKSMWARHREATAVADDERPEAHVS